jgi:hypothetical protein
MHIAGMPRKRDGKEKGGYNILLCIRDGKAEFLKPGSNLQQGSSKNIRRVLQELDLLDRDGKMLYQAMQFRQRERNKELTQFVDQASVGT